MTRERAVVSPAAPMMELVEWMGTVTAAPTVRTVHEHGTGKCRLLGGGAGGGGVSFGALPYICPSCRA